MHYTQLAIAFAAILLWIVVMAYHIMLLDVYYNKSNYQKSAGGIVTIFFFNALTSIVMEYVNKGRLWTIPIDLLQLREPFEFVMYVRKWFAMRNERWHDSKFREHIRYETFPVYLCSLIVQVQAYLVFREATDQTLQVGALIVTSIAATYSLMHCRWCQCSCDVHLRSLHSAHTNLTINAHTNLTINLHLYTLKS
jgi:hypothetical protein